MKNYQKPAIEIFTYQSERGYEKSVALHRDHLLIEGEDKETLRASDEISEFTERNEETGEDEFQTGLWTI